MPMQNEELINYIQHCRDQYIPDKLITEELLKMGHTKEDVKAAFEGLIAALPPEERAKQKLPKMLPREKKGSKKKYVALAIVLIALSGAVAWGFLYLQKDRQAAAPEEKKEEEERIAPEEAFPASERYSAESEGESGREGMAVNLINTRLASVKEGYDVYGNDAGFNRMGTRVAYIAQKEDRLYVFENEMLAGGPYDGVFALQFDPGGTQLAFVAERNGKKFFVLGGREDPAFDDVGAEHTRFIFSKDGSVVAYLAKMGSPDVAGEKSFAVVNGKRGVEYAATHDLAVSPDGRHVAYVGERWVYIKTRPFYKSMVSVDGDEGSVMYERARDLLFSADGQRMAFIATDEEGKEYVVVNRQESRARYDGISSPVFSPDGKTLAYIARRGDREFVALDDGAEGSAYEEIMEGSIVFSPDGRSFAYVATEEGKYFMVRDNEEGSPYDVVDAPTFGADAESFAFRASRNGKSFIVSDGTEGPLFDEVSPPLFGYEGGKVSYVARWGGEYFAVIGDMQEAARGEAKNVIFGPSGRSYAYEIAHEGGAGIVMNGQGGDAYDAVYDAHFTEDGAHVVFGALRGNDWWWIVRSVTEDGASAPIVVRDVREGECAMRYEVFSFGKKVAELPLRRCEINRSRVLFYDKETAYFSVLPAGLGGYALYGGYNNLYAFSFVDHSVREVFSLRSVTDIDFTKDRRSVVYEAEGSIVIKNISDDTERIFALPTAAQDAHYGNFTFSPDEEKIAVAVGYGPLDERGEVYILDIASGAYTLYKKTKEIPHIAGWLNNNEVEIK